MTIMAIVPILMIIRVTVIIAETETETETGTGTGIETEIETGTGTKTRPGTAGANGVAGNKCETVTMIRIWIEFGIEVRIMGVNYISADLLATAETTLHVTLA